MEYPHDGTENGSPPETMIEKVEKQYTKTIMDCINQSKINDFCDFIIHVKLSEEQGEQILRSVLTSCHPLFEKQKHLVG